jgi:hypothetical protein
MSYTKWQITEVLKITKENKRNPQAKCLGVLFAKKAI